MQTDRPMGAPVEGFAPPPPPGPAEIEGRFMRLERLDADLHSNDLFEANRGHDEVWDYLPAGPYDDFADYLAAQRQAAALKDPYFYAIRSLASGRVLGVASFMRIDPSNGVIEIGSIQMAPALQRTGAASEALMLMIAWAFQAGYRRVEWKCNALNAPSRRAALRLGFGYEGLFRQHMLIKGRNRDTAWFSIVDGDWPALSAAYDSWLSQDNFDHEGRQRRSLSELTEAALPGRRDG